MTAKRALQGETFDAELVDSTSQFLQRAADRADDDKTEDLSREANKTTYNLITTNAQGIEQRAIEAASLTEATHDAWRLVAEEGDTVKRAQLEWDGGNEVSHIYDRDQGVELDRPDGLVLAHEAQLKREQAAVSRHGLKRKPNSSANPRRFQGESPPKISHSRRLITTAGAMRSIPLVRMSFNTIPNWRPLFRALSKRMRSGLSHRP